MIRNNVENLKTVYVIDVETSGPNVFENDLLSLHISPLLNRGPALDLYVKYRKKTVKWGAIGKRYFQKYASTWDLEAVFEDDAWGGIKNYFEEQAVYGDITLAGHNVAFDYYFLKKLAHLNSERLPTIISHRLVDTHTLLFLLNIQGIIPKSALSLSGAISYLEIEIDQDERHTARGDVAATKALILKAFSKLENQASLFDEFLTDSGI